jgi:tagatose 1,6-diphosphate aldolase
LDYAKKKPSVVKGSMAEFSKPQYKIDVLKVEVPINPAYVEGSRGFKGQKAYSRAEALNHFRDAASVATKPFIYLSAGVTNPVFIENLEFAAESGTDYSGVLCGRATWLDGVKIYGEKGLKALEDWLSVEGVKNIEAVNAAAKGATPWQKKAGVASA